LLLLASPSGGYAQDVWIEGRLSLWVTAPKDDNPLFRYGRDAQVGFTALLPENRSLVWSYNLYDFPGPAGSRTDQFYYRIISPSGRSAITLGRFYAPFGAPGFSAYDKYVETGSEAALVNALVDAFGDGVMASRGFGHLRLAGAVQETALQGDHDEYFFARAHLSLPEVSLGLSAYREAGGVAHQSALAGYLERRTASGTFAVQYLRGRPLGVSAQAWLARAEHKRGPWSLFLTRADYRPEAAPRGSTTKVGASREVWPLTTISLWFEDNKQSPDHFILEFDTRLR